MLDRFRDEIDTIDEQVMQLLGRRFAVCREVADFKREQGIPMMQSARVEQVYERAREILKVERLPCTILVTKDAEILGRFEGYMPAAEVYQKLAAAKQVHLQLVEATGRATVQ